MAELALTGVTEAAGVLFGPAAAALAEHPDDCTRLLLEWRSALATPRCATSPPRRSSAWDWAAVDYRLRSGSIAALTLWN